MKRWAIITVTLYALLLLLLTVPVVFVGWARWESTPGGTRQWEFNVSPGDVLEGMQHWGYWLWLAVFVSAQALLLVVPVKMAERRPASRRHLLVPVVTGSFLLGNMFLGGVLAILAAFKGDHIDKLYEAPVAATSQMIQLIPGLAPTLARFGLMPDDNQIFVLHLLAWVALFWLVWGLIFHHFAKSDEAETLVQRTTRWLLRGSILELLVAVPSHIVTRQREDCCAPMISFWGIVTGISVMLMSFGPGVLFLFARKMRQKRPKPPVA
jgi:hypothetical protein